jgi:hypothetical protein
LDANIANGDTGLLSDGYQYDPATQSCTVCPASTYRPAPGSLKTSPSTYHTVADDSLQICLDW